MEYHLSFGAHLLAWVFPAILVLAAIADLIWGKYARKDKS